MQFQTSLLFIVASINSILSILVLFGKKDKTNIVYSLFVLFASFWSIGLAFFILESNLNLALYIADFYYIAAAGIPLFFLYFSLVFPYKEFQVSKSYLFVLALPIIAFTIILFIHPDLIIAKIFTESWGKNVLINQSNYLIYTVYFILFTLLSYVNLFRSYFISKTASIRSQLKFIIVGTLIGFIFGMVFDLLLPLLGIYRYIFIGPVFSFSMVFAIAYSITTYRLFNIKIIATETATFILWISILIRTLIADNFTDKLINAAFLIIAIIIGIFLIRSVSQEIKQREKIEKLADDLKRANESLASANNRLKELDQLKSEFLSLATHQIRAPLTAVKGYASLILEGDYGPITDGVRESVQTIFNSCQNLVVIVGDFLDISRIEQGKMKYDIVDFSGIKLVKNIIKELLPNIEKAGLQVQVEIGNNMMEQPPIPSDTDDENIHKQYNIHADEGKTKQIIGNIIDNAIKYSIHGIIKVSLNRNETTTCVAVTDSGIGISQEDIPKLFGKFVRAKDANKTNVIGTGLGLYVAKQMVEAQGGKIWVESPGIDQGSTFFVEMPSK